MSSYDKKKAELRAPHSASLNLLKLIAALSLILPLLIFSVAAWLSYNAHLKDARMQLEAQTDLAIQHARRVFSIFDLAASETEEALLPFTDEEITARDSELSAKLDRLSAALPEIEDIWVIDADGRPLVTSIVTPAPRDVDFSKQSFFAAQRDATTGTYISDRMPGYFRPSQFFKVSYRRHTADNGFRGAIVLSGDPRSFESFYESMLGESVSMMSLVRADGAILARVPERSDVSRMPPDAPFLRARETSPNRGFFTNYSTVDGVKRLIAYRAIAPMQVYVLAGIDQKIIISHWLQAMARQLYFGLPATLALFFVCLAAIRQARRQGEILAELQREEQRRAFAEEALRQANKMEAIGRLTGGVAHDFNNLLQVMLGRLARINKAAQQKLPPTLRDIDAMQFAIDRAANLTHRLLAFSRQQPLQMDIVDVNKLIAGMTELVRQTAGNEIVVETVYANGVWPVSIDANQLENAILNLTSNARDAMSGGGRITIRTENIANDALHGPPGPDLAPGDYVCISLADTGHGIAPEMIEKIFEPFFTTKPVGQGTGLGLSMVYGFLRQSGGHVTIASEVGHGTVVRLLLPRVAGELPTAEPGKGGPGAEAPGSGVILVVEDEIEVRRLVLDTLRDAGYTVLAAPTARDGLRLLENNPSVELLLSDIGLPDGMSGVQLADEARRSRPDLRILLMTGYVHNSGQMDQIDPRVTVLNKPFTREALLRRLREALSPHDVVN